jgi:hypothetical protein
MFPVKHFLSYCIMSNCFRRRALGGLALFAALVCSCATPNLRYYLVSDPPANDRKWESDAKRVKYFYEWNVMDEARPLPRDGIAGVCSQYESQNAIVHEGDKQISIPCDSLAAYLQSHYAATDSILVPTGEYFNGQDFGLWVKQSLIGAGLMGGIGILTSAGICYDEEDRLSSDRSDCGEPDAMMSWIVAGGMWGIGNIWYLVHSFFANYDVILLHNPPAATPEEKAQLQKL